MNVVTKSGLREPDANQKLVAFDIILMSLGKTWFHIFDYIYG